MAITQLNQILKKPPKGQQAYLEAERKSLEAEKKAIVGDQIALDAAAKLADELDGKELAFRFSTIVEGHEVVLIRSAAAAKK